MKTCKNCGACPTCGRHYGYYNYPYIPYVPYYPYWNPIIQTVTSTYTTPINTDPTAWSYGHTTFQINSSQMQNKG